MHRSRPSVLVIFAAVAACSTQDDSKGTEILSQDRTLVAGLQSNQGAPLPAACGTITLAPQPAAANQLQATELTRKAYDAEMQGDVQGARSLLRRAAQLDGTNKSAAYHLGLTSETLGDRSAAVEAYCRYLALSPTAAEAAEARQRVTKLSQPVTRVATGSVADSVPTAAPAPTGTVTARRPTRREATVAPRTVASATSERPARASSVRRDRDAERATPSVVNEAPTSGDPVTTRTEVDRPAESTAAGGDVVAASSPAPVVEQPSTAPRAERRGPSRAQGAGIGAAAGAIIGAATGRSVKSAVIGAAAGGIFGTMMGGQTRFIGRGIVP
ncbi:MAG TPA: YMGG-like glycine zipper-containing protein [Gemmatimonadaceae bacterium]|nr:YMGG-like glycine zipper-containing protein [Gemmatimonadaceae bacterium]